ncbi:hypothetical protein [Spiroplasma endosymbiont of Notiophilus biguttatus]|uniref:hypothetical protein n=1 Tax=Spiroplasma endosymbiont of Notiophilus biguttatus TaxID=3066285 RepID=UPI00313DCF08
MPWFNELIKKFRNYPLTDENLDEVVETFKIFFKEYNEKNNFFSNSEDTDFESPSTSAPLTQLKENKKTDLDKLIKELRNDLKYNFFSYFWEKKENLKLIRQLDYFLIELDNKIKKQNEKLLSLEKNKTLIEQNKINKTNQNSTEFIEITDYFNLFNFLSETISNDIIFLKTINLNIFENKKEFFKKTRELKIKIDKEIRRLYQKNEELENKKEKIFENLFKEEVMTQLILSFWAFRMKSGDEYKLILKEDKDLKSKFDKNFVFFFELIDDIFNRYIKKIIKNEERIYNDIFEKYNDREKELISEQEEIIKTKDKVKESIELFKNELEEKKEQIRIHQKEIAEKRKQIENLEKRKKNIKNKKISYLQDLEENKNNIENQILIKNISDDKKGKKQYLKEIDVVIKKKNSDIKKKNDYIAELQDNITRHDTELNINDKKIKKIEDKINKIEDFFKQNKHTMMFELKKIKEKWIKNISKDQKIFINFLKEVNKLENMEFIKIIENYWEENADSIEKFNENFNIQNNLENIREENEKIENEFKNDFTTLEINFKLKEKEIIENAIREKKEKIQESLRTINQSKLVSIEIQTEINQENEKPSWQDQKIEEQNKTIEKLEFQINDLEKKIISIKELHEDEVKDLSTTLENIRYFFAMESKKTTENCDNLKNNLNKKNSKKEEQKIKNTLNEEEIKLTSLNEVWKLISSEIPELQQSLSEESKNASEQKWDNMGVIESQLSSETKAEILNTV